MPLGDLEGLVDLRNAVSNASEGGALGRQKRSRVLEAKEGEQST